MRDLIALLKGNLWLFVPAAALFGVTFLWLRFLSRMRVNAEEQLIRLYRTDLDAYIERLRGNRRLRLVFRKSTLLLYLLDGYMAQGDEENARKAVERLDAMRLSPQERVEFYQKRLSFFAQVQNAAEANKSYTLLESYLTRMKAEGTEKYAEMLAEAKNILRIYIDRDVKLIGPLMQKAAGTKNPVLRGVTQYRVAKLAYFKGDMETVEKYLRRAQGNVAGTYYEAVVEAAIADKAVLESK
ncbi:MAG: hypothetical protein ABFC62_02165 [Clostridiaceae bacterium]|nr:hypothetical protein [Eubacteriales bacterium]